jgi:hypothetical protein
METWNKIAHELDEMEIPKKISPKFKRRLRAIGLEIQELQKRFLEWNKKAYALITKPHFIFSGDEEREIGFLHYSGLLQNIRDHIDNRMVMIVSNYNRVQDMYSSQVNFVIAISSFIATLLGLVATLLTMWGAG